MTVILIMLVLAAIFVIVVPRFVGVSLRPDTPPRRREQTTGRENKPPSSPVGPVTQLRRASTRLVVALLMLAAGTALLVFLTVRWVLQWLERILS